jgi:nucleotide-binding universal stress UspA family protein
MQRLSVREVHSGGQPFRKILVAFDDSELAMKVLSVATELAKRVGAHLLILRIFRRPNYTYALGLVPLLPHSLPAVEEQDVRLAELRLERVVFMTGIQGVSARGKVLQSQFSIDMEIVRTAIREKADLVVVGRRNFGRLKRLFGGSISSGVIAQASCPVLVVK